MVSVCLVLIMGGAIITTIRDWADIGPDEENMFNKNWGASVTVDSWGDEETSGSGYGMDLMNAKVGKVWRIPYSAPTLFVQRETLYDKINPHFSFQREIFGVALMPPESVTVRKRNVTISNSTGVV